MIKLSCYVLYSTDMERVRDFYTALGLEFRPESHEANIAHYATDVSGITLEIYPGEGRGRSRIEFTVASVTAIIERMTQAGFPPRPSRRGTKLDYAEFDDPDGRRIVIREATK